MPKNGEGRRGDFQEVLDPNTPYVWDEGPAYFRLPGQEAQAPDPTAIARRLAAKVRTLNAKRQARIQRPARYFTIPKKG